MTLKVLRASSPAEKRQWLELWEAWPWREIAAHPDYVNLFTGSGQEAVCLAWESSGTQILFPLILRAIANEPWAPGVAGVDAEGPYGYGGPFYWGEPCSDIEHFWGAFDGWARQSGVVATFARLSLFSDALAPFQRGNIVATQLNVVRDLAYCDEDLLRDYEHKVRKNVRRARACGLSVEFDMNASRLDEFLSVYSATMDRRSAADRYYFGREFFQRLSRDLDGHYVFAHAVKDRRVLSTELVLLSSTHAYSFLGGTSSEAFSMRPNDLLKHEIARWARDCGKAAYVLGGGYGGEDGIYRYKRSFAPNGQREFRVWNHVVDRNAYERLLAMRQRYEAANGNDEWTPVTNYFPSYRG